jgi:hypothetical protein
MSDGSQPNRTLDNLFSLVELLRGELTDFRAEFTEFRDRVEVRLLSTTPLGETVDLVRADIAVLAERQTTLSTEMSGIAKTNAEIAKASRRIESKVNGISIDFAEIKGTLQNHEERLEALNS